MPRCPYTSRGIDTRVHVVEHVPADVIGIIVDDKVIAAVPAPVRANGPIPGGNFKIEAAGEPEAVVILVDAFDAIAVICPEMLEFSVFERMVETKPVVRVS